MAGGSACRQVQATSNRAKQLVLSTHIRTQRHTYTHSSLLTLVVLLLLLAALDSAGKHLPVVILSLVGLGVVA